MLTGGAAVYADADFFACPDNTAHIALEVPGPDLALPGLHIADVAGGGELAQRQLDQVDK